MWVPFHHHSSWFPSGTDHFETISTFHSCICISCFYLCHRIIKCSLVSARPEADEASPSLTCPVGREHPWEQCPHQRYTDITTSLLFRSLRASKNSFHSEKPTKISARGVFFLSNFPTWCALFWLAMAHQSCSALDPGLFFALMRVMSIELQPWSCKWHQRVVILRAMQHLLWVWNLSYIVF